MATGSASPAERSPQAEAWESIDPETRAKMPFLDPKDFVIATSEEQAEDWMRAMGNLDQAKRYQAI